MLKWRLFTVLPMLDWVIKKVNRISAHKKQEQEFQFLNCWMEPYKWTNSLPKDNPEFQGLLEEEEPVAYLDISAKLPGVKLESEAADFQVVRERSEPNFTYWQGR
jgi:hypothetical protein